MISTGTFPNEDSEANRLSQQPPAVPRLVGMLDGYAICATLRGVISEFALHKVDRSIVLHDDAVVEILDEVGRHYDANELPAAMRAAGVETLFSDWDARVPAAPVRHPLGEFSEDWDAMTPRPLPDRGSWPIFHSDEWAA